MTVRQQFRTSIVAIAAVICTQVGTAEAETLKDALAKAYQFNPTLTSARATQRARDEDVAIARAAGRPNAQVNGTYNENIQQPRTSLAFGGQKRNASLQASAQAPLISGGAVRNNVAATRLRSAAGREGLRATEADLFAQVVAAYLDVIRDSSIVQLNEQNVTSLSTNLRATNDRFQVGDVTRTDVAQSESRLALAQASLESARAQLIASKENYTALVGEPPVDLEPPTPLPGLPDSTETAVATALNDNPDILAARKVRDAARYDIRSAKGAVSPRVSLFAEGSYLSYLGSNANSSLSSSNSANLTKSVTVGAQVVVPIYQGGRPSAVQRQAVDRESSAIEQAVGTERSVIAQARGAFASWQASLRNIESTKKAVDAAELSLEGVKAENSVGTRTILDILNAEQEALNARVQLVTAKRNAYVAAFNLLASIGHGEAADLGIATGGGYDPVANYDEANRSILDWDFKPNAEPIAPSTANTPAQNATPLQIPGF